MNRAQGSLTGLRMLGLWMLVVFGLYISFPTDTRAAINEQIAFYGTLQNNSGTNLSGTYDMVFRFYDAPTGGTLLDTSTHTAANGNAVSVSSGEFTAMLGSGTGNTLDGLNFNTAAIYVGLTIGSDSEMSPRERLAASAYAFNADKVDGYDANQLLRYNATGSITANSAGTLFSLVQNGVGDIFNAFDGLTKVFTILDGGNVGIGTSTPSQKLTVVGDARLTGRLYDNTNTAGVNGMVLQSTGIGSGGLLLQH
jgi:hypothetical protein